IRAAHSPANAGFGRNGRGSSAGKRPIRSNESGPDERDGGVGVAIDVRGGKAEETKAGVHEAVLSAVVLDQAVAVGTAVVLQAEPLGRIAEVWPSQKATAVVVELELCFGPRKPCQDKQQA